MKKIRILVVDDHPVVRRGISACLAGRENLEIVGEAADGREAVKKARELQPDIMLMDINMPQMNGLDLISYIRSQHREPKLPIIVITTQGEEEARDKGMAQGANAYLTKPISGPKLVSLVKELLD